MCWILLWYQFIFDIVSWWATSENISNFWGWKTPVAFILPPLPPFSTSIRMSWRIICQPIWGSESNCTLGFSVPPLVFALPAKMSPVDSCGNFRKLEVKFEIFKCSLRALRARDHGCVLTPSHYVNKLQKSQLGQQKNQLNRFGVDWNQTKIRKTGF